MSVVEALEALMRRPQRAPKQIWMRIKAAKVFRSDLDDLGCIDCGAPAEWCWVAEGELRGLCQDHIGDHVP